MLEKLDLSKKVSKEEYNRQMEVLGERLGKAQRMARDAKRPIIIVFEGWRGARRSALINEMMQQMDARGFNVYSSVRLRGVMQEQPFFGAFWKRLPALGHIAVYHRSWYYLKNANELADKEDNTKYPAVSFEHINNFEKMLTDDNYLVLKFFLHLSPEQQKKNIAKNAKTLGKAWRDLNPALDESEDYDKFLPHYEKMLEATDTVNAPWHLIADDDPRSARLEVFTKIADAIEKAVQMPVEPAADKRTAATYDVLSKIDANKELTKEEYKEKLEKYQKKLTQLQIEMFKAQIPVVIGFEGWDAAGKGGAIRRLTAALDPLGFHVHPIAAPNVVEKQFHYQWRFWTRLPQPGTIAIFDRTWYGRVMVERLEGFCTESDWKRAYTEINEFEQQLTDWGAVVLKFWVQIDKDTQLKRFEDRQNDPDKQWKITEEDWRNREKWDSYEQAIDEMLQKTSTQYAPWHIIESNCKYYARIKALELLTDALEAAIDKAQKQNKK